ncbi:MAG: hypothetical protein D8M59_02320 [Planctomycetes bacterium]|nr:hypothetical protein [Planctomycetota bacterium]NOG54446.1 AAA family ATPase [Planctomycetota bacterium]
MSAMNRIIEALRSHGCDPKPRGRGYRARCPAHDDRNPSLDVDEGDEGRVLMTCRAGCDNKHIVAKIGKTMADLMPDHQGGTSGNTRRTATKAKRPFDTLEAAIQAGERSTKGTHAATYIYKAREGSVVGAVVRFDLPTPGGEKQTKTFRPFHFVQEGWRFGDPHGGFPLYRLHLLARDGSRRVDLFEGEKCADAAAEIGLNSTSIAHGARGIKTTDLSPLTEQTVYLWPDHDKAGEAWAQELAAALRDIGCKVYICRIPGLPDKGDIVDALGVDGPWHDLDAAECRELMGAIVEAAPVWRAPEGARDTARSAATTTGLGLRAKPMSEIEPAPVMWLWPDRIPLAKVSIFAGEPGKNKSTIALDIAARVSTGCGWPDAQGVTYEPGSVLLISAEDGAADTIRPRLDLAGADVSRIKWVEGTDAIPPFDPEQAVKPEPELRPFDISQDIADLEQTISNTPNCRLVLLDPIGAFLGDSTNSHRDADVRRLLHPLSMLAERTGVAVVAIMHFRKSGGSGVHAVQGSIAWTAAARAVWGFMEDFDNPHLGRLMLPMKMNLARDTNGLGCRIESGDNGHPYIEWYPVPVEMTYDEAMAEAARLQAETERRAPGPVPEALNTAVSWLEDALADGPRQVREIEGVAKTAGISEGTLKRARRKLNVISEPGAGRIYWMRMPEQVEQDSPEHERPAQPAPCDLYTTSEPAPPVAENPTNGSESKGGSGCTS